MTSYQSILITGASSGLGKALAEIYAGNEITLFLSGRNQARLEDTATHCRKQGATVYTKLIDVTDKQAMQDWIKTCDDTATLSLVIANAGVSNSGAKFDADVSQRIFDINLQGVLNTAHPAVACFQKHKAGHLVLMSSLAGVCGVSREPSYSASKAAVKEFGIMLGGQLRPQGIYVSVICPGFVKTALTDKNRYHMPLIMSAERAAQIMQKNIAKRKPLIVYPYRMFFLARLGSMLPVKWLLFFLKYFKEFDSKADI